jgi:hypothetical protein
MKLISLPKKVLCVCGLIVCVALLSVDSSFGADRSIGLHSARVLAQSLAWKAEEAGLFQKFNFDMPLAVTPFDASALNGKPQDLVERRSIDEIEKSGFFDKLRTEKT